jgi:hypothetical protein
MITLEAKWDEKQKNILMSRLSAVTRMVYYYMQPPGELPRMLSIKYVEEVRKYLLDARRGRFGYTPYNAEYSEWKKKFGRYSGFWSLFGDLVENVKSSRAEGGYFGGVVSTAMDRGGKSWYGKGDKGESKSIAMYGTVMEEGSPNIRGSGVHPARPLFVPVFKEFVYSKSRGEAGMAWGICDSALMKIGSKWEGK